MTRPPAAPALAAVLAVALAGCGPRLDFKAEGVSVGPNPYTQVVDGFPSPTPLTVSLSSDQPVHLFVLPDSIVNDEAEGTMQGGKAPPKALGHQLNTKSADLKLTAPAGEKIRLYVVPAAKTAKITLSAKN